MRHRKRIRQINLRIDEELRRKLEAAAKERRISINQFITQQLEDGLESKAKQPLESIVRRLVDLTDRMQGSPRALLDTKRPQRKKEGGDT